MLKSLWREIRSASSHHSSRRTIPSVVVHVASVHAHVRVVASRRSISLASSIEVSSSSHRWSFHWSSVSSSAASSVVRVSSASAESSIVEAVSSASSSHVPAVPIVLVVVVHVLVVHHVVHIVAHAISLLAVLKFFLDVVRLAVVAVGAPSSLALVDVLAVRTRPVVLLEQLGEHIGLILYLGDVWSLDSTPITVNTLGPVYITTRRIWTQPVSLFDYRRFRSRFIEKRINDV